MDSPLTRSGSRVEIFPTKIDSDPNIEPDDESGDEHASLNFAIPSVHELQHTVRYTLG